MVIVTFPNGKQLVVPPKKKSDACQRKQTTVCPVYCHPVWFVVHSLHVLIFVDILSDPNHIAQGSAGYY